MAMLYTIVPAFFRLQAIENGIGYGGWLHGEAVAAGTVKQAQL
jgi:hypothetical protein